MKYDDKNNAAGDMSLWEKGIKCYGDDMTQEEINAWFDDEEKGFSDIYFEETDYRYPYRALDRKCFWNHIPQDANHLTCLGIGSADGQELLPIADRVARFYILEPGKKFYRDKIKNTPATYISPSRTGVLPFEDSFFDLVSCLSCLHHVPNVSFVMSEIYRTLKPGGRLLLRDPIVSMRLVNSKEDWSRDAAGLTKRERGIHLHFYRHLIEKLGYRMMDEKLCGFGPLRKITRLFRIQPHRSSVGVVIDLFFSRIFAFNYHYICRTSLQKFAPTMACWLLQKPGQ